MDDYFPSELALSLTSELFAGQKTVLDHYHGGSMYDEVTALLSLTHGVRMQAGAVTRRFESGADPRGRPVTPDDVPPSLLPRRGSGVIPGVIRVDEKVQAGLVPSYPHLFPADALALSRAARSYQEAIWIADGDPQFAWLLLVSAVETAAVRWFRAINAPDSTNSEVLRAGKPELANLLETAGGEYLLDCVAAQFAEGMRSGFKFRKFLLEFAPSPPEPRPAAQWGMLDWSASSLNTVLLKVYEHRSKALHASVPFPFPMCQPPIHFRNEAGEDTLTERPGGGASFAKGGVWHHADTPILLWAFEHLARGALLNWWASIAPGPTGQ
jgi:hypothetical protein